MNTIFLYFDIGGNKPILSPISICLQNHPGQNNNYFFSVSKDLFSDWKNFIIKTKMFNENDNSYQFSILPKKYLSTSPDIDFYSLNYDLHIFNSYDLAPIKVFTNKMFTKCDVHVGKFFFERYYYLN